MDGVGVWVSGGGKPHLHKTARKSGRAISPGALAWFCLDLHAGPLTPHCTSCFFCRFGLILRGTGSDQERLVLQGLQTSSQLLSLGLKYYLHTASSGTLNEKQLTNL